MIAGIIGPANGPVKRRFDGGFAGVYGMVHAP
jgi:hypothetical protein